MDNPIGLESGDAMADKPSLERLKTCWIHFANHSDSAEKVSHTMYNQNL